MIQYSDFKYFSAPSSTDLARGYVYSQEDLKDLSTQSVNNYSFGLMESDTVEISVMSIDGGILTTERITSSLNYVPYTKSYIDLNGDGVTYNYRSFQSDFVTVGVATRSLFLDIAQVFSDVGLSSGTYKIGIDPVRYLVGSPFETTRSLVVRQVSPSGKEISVSPSTPSGSTELNDINFNDRYNSFTSDKFPVKQVITKLLSGIETPLIYNAYYDAYKVDSGSAESAKNWYGFIGDVDWKSVQAGQKNVAYSDRKKSDIAMIQFITDIFHGVQKGALKSNGHVNKSDIFGIFDQFSNTLFQNYESPTSFGELKDFYYSLFVSILKRELNGITNKVPDNLSDIIGFFQKILFDSIFVPVINELESSYETYFTGYLKNFANFETSASLPILNYTASKNVDQSGNGLVILKFIDRVPTSIVAGTKLYITNKMVSETVVQNVYLYIDNQIKTVVLRGPNMLIRVETEGNGTNVLSSETIVDVTGSQYNEIFTRLDAKSRQSLPLNVDYRYFENFVRFSSANDRLNLFTAKDAQIRSYKAAISELEVKVVLHPNDVMYQNELSNVNKLLDDVEASMDGYETFLYNNPSWYNEHSNVYSGETSASRYDENNLSSLYFGLPSYIREDSNNSDYITFVNMVGHFFDNMSAYIEQFTQKNNPNSSPTVGISKDVVYYMLSSLGWEPEMGRENLPLLLSSFSKDDFDNGSDLWNMVGSMSEDTRNKTIWKRILNNLPYILKKKGTRSAINALLNCYGVPQNFIRISEYGGIENSDSVSKDSLYVFDETKYPVNFDGRGEYLAFPWTGSVNSLEFNFSFNPDRTVEDGKIFRVVNCSDVWAVGFYRERGQDWGRAFFSIRDTGSNILTAMTPRAPIFDGNTYSVLLKKNSLHSDFLVNPTASSDVVDTYPQKYELFVQRNEFARSTYIVSASILLSGSFNSEWRTGSSLFFGNYQQSTSSLVTDPEAFFGTIDEIRLWETEVSLNRYNNHSAYRGSHDSDSPSDVVDKELARMSFGYPIDLYSSATSMSVNNFAFRPDFPTFDAFNFPVSSASVSIDGECQEHTYTDGYPYQFKPYNISQNVKLPNFGSNKFRNNKINYVKQTMLSELSSESRSSLQSGLDVPADSNKLGIFISPTDQINSEIMKFFGDFEFGDLVGRPSDMYRKTYPIFEQFRQLYFSQGGGQMDYQTFLNMVRTYFDKSMFKYVRNLVPARARVVSGILIEPSVMERSKIQQRPVNQEIHRNFDTRIVAADKQTFTIIPTLSDSIRIKTTGTEPNNDYNRMFYADRLDPYGFGIYAENGVAFYQGDYWRADVLSVTKTITVDRKIVPPLRSLSPYDKINSNHGHLQTVSKSFETVNVSRFPLLTQYPIQPTLELGAGSYLYFSGSISAFSWAVNPGYSSGTHSISQYISSSVISDPARLHGEVTTTYVVDATGKSGVIQQPIGLNGQLISSQSVYLAGVFNFSDNTTFVGTVWYARMNSQFYSLDGTTSIYETLLKNTQGPLFTSIISNSYKYRYDLSFKNVPLGARPLNGYHFTHYRYKKPLFSRRTVPVLDNTGTQIGIFSKGLQTQKTTVQSDGLADNSPPVTITKSS